MAMKSSKKLREDSDSSAIIQNKVHQLIEYIENNFRDKGRIKKSFATAALTGALRFLDEISRADGISKQNKIDLLTKIYEAANQEIDALANEQPDVPLWEKRPKSQWRMSPCRFVELHYPTYGQGLTTDDVKDRKLLQALQNFKKRYGWPEDFKLETKTQALNRLVEEQGSDIHLRGLADAPPRVRRERKRIWQAHARRLRG